MTLPRLGPIPGSKFRVLDYPSSLPSKCAVCGNPGGDGRKFIDFGFDLDFFGTVYFCSICLNECVNTLEYPSPEQWNYAKEENERLANSLRKLEAENVALRVSLSQLNFLGVLPYSSEAPSGSETITSKSNVSDGKTDSQEGSDNSRSNESPDESRSKNVSSNDGNSQKVRSNFSDFDDDI